METLQVTITLDGTETALLRQAAMRELRRPREQARFLLRQALLAATDNPETRNRGAMDSDPQRAAAAP